MARTKKSKAAVAGKPVDAGDTFPLGTDEANAAAANVALILAHKSAGDMNADMPTAWVDPATVSIEDDTRTIPAANQGEIDQDLAVNIFIFGQKQPALVVADPIDGGKFIAVTGRTRRRAVALINAGFNAIDPRTGEPATFHDPERKLWVALDRDRSKEDTFVADLVTQIKVNALTPVQEAYAVKRLTEKYDWSLTDAAKLFGYNNTNRQAKLLKLLDMDAETIDRVHSGQMSLDAAVSLAGLKTEKRHTLISSATGTDGVIDPTKLRGLLRDVYSNGDEEVKQVLDGAYGYSSEAKAETAAAEVTEPAAKKGGGKAAAKDAPRFVKRGVSDLTKFIAEQVEDEATPAPVRELFAKLALWFTGEVGDRSLWNTIETTVKQK